MGHIFISYSHKDKDYVHRLQEALQNEGFEVWIDDRINYGTRWPKVIQEQLDSCSAFIVVVSENAFASEWVQNEVARAKRKGKPFFPLLLSGDPWLSVETTQYVDVQDNSLPPQKFYNEISKIVPRLKKQTPLAAVFIDGFWLYYACKRQKLTEKFDYEKLMGAIRRYFGEQTSTYYFYAFKPDIYEEQVKHVNILRKAGYIIELGSFVERKLANGTTFTHVRGIESLLVLRASTLPKDVEKVVLITGDSEFAPLIDHLQKVSKEILLVTDIKNSRHLRKAIKSDAIDIKSFINNIDLDKNPFIKSRIDVSNNLSESTLHVPRG